MANSASGVKILATRSIADALGREDCLA